MPLRTSLNGEGRCHYFRLHRHPQRSFSGASDATVMPSTARGVFRGGAMPLLPSGDRTLCSAERCHQLHTMVMGESVMPQLPLEQTLGTMPHRVSEGTDPMKPTR